MLQYVCIYSLIAYIMYFSPVFRDIFVNISENAMLHLTGNCVHLPGKCLHHAYIYSKIAYIYLQIKENTLLHTCVCAYMCARIYAHARTREGIKKAAKGNNIPWRRERKFRSRSRRHNPAASCWLRSSVQSLFRYTTL